MQTFLRTILFAVSTVAATAFVAPAATAVEVPAAAPVMAQLLFVQNAAGVEIGAGGKTLTLKNFSPTTLFFSDRPVRIAGHYRTDEYLQFWKAGPDSFLKDPPNATLSVFTKDGSSVADLVAVLSNATLAGDRLTFDVRVLEGDLGKADGPASLFIDTLWWGVGSNGFTYYGTSDTGNTGGITPNVEDPNGGSSFTGWSNPSPTAPYRPSYNYNRPVGAPPPPDVDPRYQPSYNAPTCGKPPLLPCY